MNLNDVLERGQEAMRPPVSGQVVGVQAADIQPVGGFQGTGVGVVLAIGILQ